mmetsp:Transcript_14502/g.33577  ORF Transcript_14502/g.33577 Transcript_14502/m.33577 type:complete len:250 (-) Transcript_14502:492-1241(-)
MAALVVRDALLFGFGLGSMSMIPPFNEVGAEVGRRLRFGEERVGAVVGVALGEAECVGIVVTGGLNTDGLLDTEGALDGTVSGDAVGTVLSNADSHCFHFFFFDLHFFLMVFRSALEYFLHLLLNRFLHFLNFFLSFLQIFGVNLVKVLPWRLKRAILFFFLKSFLYFFFSSGVMFLSICLICFLFFFLFLFLVTLGVGATVATGGSVGGSVRGATGASVGTISSAPFLRVSYWSIRSLNRSLYNFLRA